VLELGFARVRWFLSLDADDLPSQVRQAGGHAYRSLTVDGEALELSPGFTDLHTRSYEEILAGRGFRIAEARPAIELIHRMRNTEVTTPRDALRWLPMKSA
jgi:UDP-N-acetyl-2-amino-2-deoxyglucuronate dehydrogenase